DEAAARQIHIDPVRQRLDFRTMARADGAPRHGVVSQGCASEHESTSRSFRTGAPYCATAFMLKSAASKDPGSGDMQFHLGAVERGCLERTAPFEYWLGVCDRQATAGARQVAQQPRGRPSAP